MPKTSFSPALRRSNSVYGNHSAGWRGAILCTKFVPRVGGEQFCVRNSFSGSSRSNFVYEIRSADCRGAILCTKFVQRIIKTKPLQNSSYNLSFLNIFVPLWYETEVILSQFCWPIPWSKKGQADILFTNKHSHWLGTYSCYNRGGLYERL